MQNRLSPEQRLSILRTADRERKWYTLDDKRVCVVCNRVFTGREIELSHNGEEYDLHCPTPSCPSNYRHWFFCELSPARYETVGPASTEATFYQAPDPIAA